jgi:hypothetical protein
MNGDGANAAMVCLDTSFRTRRPKMAGANQVQYVSDADGNTLSVIVPIELWREIESEKETAYLLKSDFMKQRLLEAKERQEGISIGLSSQG